MRLREELADRHVGHVAPQVVHLAVTDGGGADEGGSAQRELGPLPPLLAPMKDTAVEILHLDLGELPVGTKVAQPALVSIARLVHKWRAVAAEQVTRGRVVGRRVIPLALWRDDLATDAREELGHVALGGGARRETRRRLLQGDDAEEAKEEARDDRVGRVVVRVENLDDVVKNEADADATRRRLDWPDRQRALRLGRVGLERGARDCRHQQLEEEVRLGRERYVGALALDGDILARPLLVLKVGGEAAHAHRAVDLNHIVPSRTRRDALADQLVHAEVERQHKLVPQNHIRVDDLGRRHVPKRHQPRASRKKWQGMQQSPLELLPI
eukprot:6210366-Pleurochrysis_carterae.AAC.3